MDLRLKRNLQPNEAEDGKRQVSGSMHNFPQYTAETLAESRKKPFLTESIYSRNDREGKKKITTIIFSWQLHRADVPLKV